MMRIKLAHMFIFTLLLCSSLSNANIITYNKNELTLSTVPSPSNINDNIVIESSGFKFSPVSPTSYTFSEENSDIATLYAGQEMQALDNGESGMLTGSILVEMIDPDTALSFDNADILTVGERFFIITFNEKIDLLEKLKQIKDMSIVKDAEIEVNTHSYSPL
ncbi:hypothetical protein [Moritella sp. 28]|uniref:hypothetical protein n=1 Tax=Moritella sp. 28 TaxID=2746232 RepID=UPI001BA4A4B3|nr:hypothetical protein [Moritella sp. 28]QUM83139.1 hypothetical protein HWV02_00605 [Moritella sp. 28]